MIVQPCTDIESSIIHVRYLFVKHSDGEGSDFYYMGKVKPIDWRETVKLNDDNKELPILNFIMEMEYPARADLYEYFTNERN